MSQIDREDVEYIAALAQLTIDDATKEQLVAELADILNYIEQLNEVDTSEIEPMMHVLEVANVLRDDAVQPSLDAEEVFKNAPKSDGSHFLVPRILDGGDA